MRFGWLLRRCFRAGRASSWSCGASRACSGPAGYMQWKQRSRQHCRWCMVGHLCGLPVWTCGIGAPPACLTPRAVDAHVAGSGAAVCLCTCATARNPANCKHQVTQWSMPPPPICRRVIATGGVALRDTLCHRDMEPVCSCTRGSTLYLMLDLNNICIGGLSGLPHLGCGDARKPPTDLCKISLSGTHLLHV